MAAASCRVNYGMSGSEGLNLRVQSITYQTEQIVVFELCDPEFEPLPPSEAGSHMDVELGNGLVRSYSIVEVRNPISYRIAVAREDSGRGGSRWLHDHVSVGDMLRVSLPRNNFALSPQGSHSVLIAGGIGITPIFAMLQQLEADERSWELHYSTRSRLSTAFYRELSCDFRHGKVTFYHPKADGRFVELNVIVLTRPADSHLYCCGPARMIDAFLAATSGLPSDLVHVERFGGVTETATGAFDVILARSRKTVRVQEGTTILGCLLAAGIDVPHSCQEGVCGACETKLLDGVADHRDLIQSGAEKAKNTSIFVCCSGSMTPSLTLDL